MKAIIYKTKALVSLFVLLGCSISMAAPGHDGDTKTVVKGKVQCSDQGLAGVVVTDGYNFAATDKKGYYSLPLNTEATHVYISSPSGYSVPVENGVPQFYVKLYDTIDKMHVNFNLIKMDVSDQKHYFIAIGDPQVRNEKEILQLNPILDFLKSDIRAHHFNPVHLMVVGDIVFNTPDMNDLSKESFKSVDQPVYYCIGNHDHLLRKKEPASDDYDKIADKDYISHYGPTCYSFNRGQAHYIALDNIFFKGGPLTEFNYQITRKQLDWIKKDLTYVSKDKVLIVMAHSPTKNRDGKIPDNSEELHALLKGYKDVQILAGHTHYNSVVVDGTGITEHIIGAACGGWWEGPVCPDGTYVGYKIFEVDGTKVTWKYRAYQRPDQQFSVFKPGLRNELLRPSEELLVNVWDWDSTWIVSWSENDGVTFKDMTRVGTTLDPVAYQYYGTKGDSIPAGRKFIAACPTDHIFTCVPSAGTKKIIVKVVNHFKEAFTEVVNL